MRVTLLYFDGCPNWHETAELLVSLGEEFGFDLDCRRVETPQDAERLQFRGSPTVLINGQDPFAGDDDPVGVSCRVYRTEGGLAGAPSETQLRELFAASASHGATTRP